MESTFEGPDEIQHQKNVLFLQGWAMAITTPSSPNSSKKYFYFQMVHKSKDWKDSKKLQFFSINPNCCNPSFGLATKAKGLRGCGPRGRKPRSQGKGIARVRAKRKPRSHITYSRECKKVWRSVREWTLTLPRQFSLWEMESRWTPKTSKSDLRGQNSMACGVLYIIGKLLKLRCLKRARIAHLDIWNTSYGQKKGQESNW